VRARFAAFWNQQFVSRRTLPWIFLLLLVTIVFYWRILLTRQFSLLTESEGVAQSYSWLRFWVASIRHGALPLWDPYTLAGHSFAGEMQTAVFYPLHLLLAIFPLNRYGLLSPTLYHDWFAFTHFLGACFMFALARELRLSRFAAFLAGVCFSFGGFVGRIPWPHMFESSIWLPLLFLFLLRALGTERHALSARHAAFAGLMLGLSILAGGMHIVILQFLVVVSACVYHAFTGDSSWRTTILTIALIAIVGFAAGAIQLLPSMEYSHHAIRFLGNAGALPATEKIPYQDLSDTLWPQGFITMLIPQAFNGIAGSGEVINPYLGVFPLLLAILAVWKNWTNRWVRYLTSLAIAAFLYSLGAFSLLHGMLYALVPGLWMAREAARAVYLLDFSAAILVGFGLDTLLCSGFPRLVSTTLRRILNGIVIACGAGLFAPALYGRPEINLWVTFSILLIFLSYALYRYVASGKTGRTARVLIIALVLFDLSSFDWTARNLLDLSRTGVNHLDRLLSTRGAVAFLKSQTGPFRVEVGADPKPNIGDAFSIQTTSPAGVTELNEFAWLQSHPDLLNVRFRMVRASTTQPGAVYQDAAWKIYERPSASPRAWLVHDAVVEPSPQRALAQLETPGFDPARTALVDASVPLEPAIPKAPEEVTFAAIEPNRLEVSVVASSRALLVVSEMFSSGWYASVNGRPARVYRVDAGLRGIALPGGPSRVTMRYMPRSVYIGAALTALTFLTLLAVFVCAAVPQLPSALDCQTRT
jgi:membrane protein YfhO